MMTNKTARKADVINLLRKADFEKCDMNQLVTIINLYDVLRIPMKLEDVVAEAEEINEQQN